MTRALVSVMLVTAACQTNECTRLAAASLNPRSTPCRPEPQSAETPRRIHCSRTTRLARRLTCAASAPAYRSPVAHLLERRAVLDTRFGAVRAVRAAGTASWVLAVGERGCGFLVGGVGVQRTARSAAVTWRQPGPPGLGACSPVRRVAAGARAAVAARATTRAPSAAGPAVGYDASDGALLDRSAPVSGCGMRVGALVRRCRRGHDGQNERRERQQRVD